MAKYARAKLRAACEVAPQSHPWRFVREARRPVWGLGKQGLGMQDLGMQDQQLQCSYEVPPSSRKALGQLHPSSGGSPPGFKTSASSLIGRVASGQSLSCLVLASTTGTLNYCGLPLDNPPAIPPPNRGSESVNPPSPLATMSLKTHIPSSLVSSPARVHWRHFLQVELGTGRVTCPGASEAARCLRPEAYEWPLCTQRRSGSRSAAEALGRGFAVLTTPLTPTSWFPDLTGHQEVEANA